MPITYDPVALTVTVSGTDNTLETIFSDASNAPSGNTGIYMDKLPAPLSPTYMLKGVSIIIDSSGELIIDNTTLTDDGLLPQDRPEIDLYGVLTIGRLGAVNTEIQTSDSRLPEPNHSGVIRSSPGGHAGLDYGSIICINDNAILNQYGGFIVSRKKGSLTNKGTYVVRSGLVFLDNGAVVAGRGSSIIGTDLYFQGLGIRLDKGDITGLRGYAPYYNSVGFATFKTNIDFYINEYAGVGNEVDWTYRTGCFMHFVNPKKPYKNIIVASSNTNTGGCTISFDYTPRVRDSNTKDSLSDTRLYLRDTNNGDRKSSTDTKYDFTADFTVNTVSDSLGIFTPQRLTVRVKSDDTQDSTNNDPAFDDRAPYKGVLAKYGYNLQPIINLDFVDAPLSPVFEVDKYDVEQADPTTVAAYPITIDHTNRLISLTGDTTLRQLEDYCRFDKTTSTGITHPTYSTHVIERSDNNFTSVYSIDTGMYTLTGVAGNTLNLGDKTFNGNVQNISVIDVDGILFSIAGLPATGTAKVRLQKLSDNTKTYYQADANGELYVQLPLNETYELRADDLGYYGIRGIQFNTGLQSFITVTLEPVRSYTYGLGAQTEKALYTVDSATLQISITYDPNYPTLSWQAAVDVLEEFYSSNNGLDAEYITRYSQNVIQFAENTSVTIVPDANNTANVTLGYLVAHENRAAPHALFPDTIAPRILYDVVQNVAVFTGEVTATTDNAAIAGAVWSNNTRTLTESAGGATLTDIENSTILAKEATLATKASQASVDAIPLNSLLTDDLRLDSLSNLDITVSSRLAATTYTAAPTTAAIATAVESQLADDFAGITIDLTPVNTEIARLTALLEPTGGGSERLSASALSQTPLVDVSGLATASQVSLLNNLSQSQVETAATAAIVAYAPPTRTEMASDRDTIISALPSEPPTPDSISTSVWSATTRSLTVPSGLTPTQATQLTNLDLRLTDTRALNLDNLDATVSSRLDNNSYATPPSTAAIASAVWVNATRELTQTVATLTLAEIEGSTVLAMKSDVSGLQSFITPYLDKIHTIWTGNGFDPTNPISALAPNAITPGWIRTQDLSVDQTHILNNDNSYTLSSNV